MYRRYANSSKSELAVDMMLNPTKAEAKLWPYLQALNDPNFGLQRVRWKRQVVILGWIVDFYCPRRRVVIELDGGYHKAEDQKKLDLIRDRVLFEKCLIKTVRLTNEEVLSDPQDIARRAKIYCLRRPYFKSNTQYLKYKQMRFTEALEEKQEKNRAERQKNNPAKQKPLVLKDSMVFPPTLHHLPVGRPAHIMPWD